MKKKYEAPKLYTVGERQSDGRFRVSGAMFPDRRCTLCGRTDTHSHDVSEILSNDSEPKKTKTCPICGGAEEVTVDGYSIPCPACQP